MFVICLNSGTIDCNYISINFANFRLQRQILNFCKLNMQLEQMQADAAQKEAELEIQLEIQKEKTAEAGVYFVPTHMIIDISYTLHTLIINIYIVLSSY